MGGSAWRLKREGFPGAPAQVDLAEGTPHARWPLPSSPSHAACALQPWSQHCSVSRARRRPSPPDKAARTPTCLSSCAPNNVACRPLIATCTAAALAKLMTTSVSRSIRDRRRAAAARRRRLTSLTSLTGPHARTQAGWHVFSSPRTPPRPLELDAHHRRDRTHSRPALLAGSRATTGARRTHCRTPAHARARTRASEEARGRDTRAENRRAFSAPDAACAGGRLEIIHAYSPKKPHSRYFRLSAAGRGHKREFARASGAAPGDRDKGRAAISPRGRQYLLQCWLRERMTERSRDPGAPGGDDVADIAPAARRIVAAAQANLGARHCAMHTAKLRCAHCSQSAEPWHGHGQHYHHPHVEGRQRPRAPVQVMLRSCRRHTAHLGPCFSVRIELEIGGGGFAHVHRA